MSKIKFTAFATNTKTGRRERLDDQTETPIHTHRSKAVDAVRGDLQLRGYKDIHVDDTTVTES